MNTRTKRQIKILKRWERNKYNGLLKAVTGFGKTTTAIMAIKGLVKKKNIKRVLVIVPTVNLKEQWVNKLYNNNLDHISKVMVINTAANKYKELQCDLIIYDEFHRAGSEYFSKVLNIKHKYALALTATVERSDGKHEEMLKQFPVIDEVTLEEALNNGWVSNYRIINLLVPLSETDRKKYTSAEKRFKHFAAKCRELSNSYNTLKVAQSYLKSNDKEKKSIGIGFFNSLRQKNKICKENKNKLKAADFVINNIFKEEKGFIFSSSIDFATELQKKIKSSSVMFHSKMKKKDKAKAMSDFSTGNIRLINAVSSMNEGIDVPECSIGIVISGTSSKREARQQLGRIIRATDDGSKIATFINICTEDTVEVSWANSKFEGLLFINSKLEEINNTI